MIERSTNREFIGKYCYLLPTTFDQPIQVLQQSSSPSESVDPGEISSPSSSTASDNVPRSYEEFAREKLVQELHVMRALQHRNIVKLIDCYNLPDCVALVLEK